MTLTNETSVSQFIDAADPIRLLTDATAIHFRPEDDVYQQHPATGDDVTSSLKDLKVRLLSFETVMYYAYGRYKVAKDGPEDAK